MGVGPGNKAHSWGWGLGTRLAHTFVCSCMSEKAFIQSYYRAQLLFDFIHGLVGVAAEVVLVLVLRFLHENEDVC